MYAEIAAGAIDATHRAGPRAILEQRLDKVDSAAKKARVAKLFRKLGS
jgi:hypothetical protein